MAEGFARFLAPAGTRVYSAGSAPRDVNPLAIRAMKEVGIDISNHRSKGLDGVPIDQIATVITLCKEDARPTLPAGVHHLHWPLPDPNATPASDGDAMVDFRRVRDQIRELVSRLF